MRHGCSAPRAKFRVLDWDAGWIWAWRPLLFHARALSLICTGMDDGGDQVFGRGTSEHEFFTPFGWQNLATWRNCVFRHDISELGNMSLDEFGEDSSAFFIPSGEFWASANLQNFGMFNSFGWIGKVAAFW